MSDNNATELYKVCFWEDGEQTWEDFNSKKEAIDFVKELLEDCRAESLEKYAIYKCIPIELEVVKWIEEIREKESICYSGF